MIIYTHTLLNWKSQRPLSSDPYLDLLIPVTGGSLFSKRDNFDFCIVNFLNICSCRVPSLWCLYSVVDQIHQSILVILMTERDQ